MVHNYRRLITGILLGIILFSIPSVSVLADSPSVTVTVSASVVGIPGGFTVTYVNDEQVDLSWTMPAGATNVMVRSATGRPPESRTDGNLVYYGDAESCSDTSVSLDETLVPVYYRAWSETAEGAWSPMFAEGNIEGVGMTIFAVVAIVLALMAMGFIFKNGILFLASALGWVLFAFLMYGKVFDNAALNTGLLMFGGAMALVTAFLALNMMMKDRPRKLTSEDEQEAYKRKVLKATRRR